VTLVSAPPGWGKTTLLAEWRAAQSRPERVAWLSLDAGDNDPMRFWTYVIESMRTVEPEIGTHALALLRAPGVRVVDSVLPEVLNELTRLTSRLTLVLDDYHTVTDTDVNESVAFLVEHLPPTLGLVVATRSDPPFRLGLLRARGELDEVRAEELRFSIEETVELLNEMLELGLLPDDVARLQERTEGWVAGLYLAALSLRGRTDPTEFIAAFAGDNRHIVDYLGLEVLEGQSEEIRSFLLHTSILDRLSGPLCDAVTERGGSEQTLEQIERSNLFLVPLDPSGSWRRYHNLFGELLRHELARAEPGLVPELHRRASAWYREAGFTHEAVLHAVEAGDVDEARELIALHWTPFFNLGRIATVTGWLDALPAGAVAADARLCIARAWLTMDRGRLLEVERWIEAAEVALAPLPDLTEREELAYGVAVLRAVHRFKSGDVAAAHAAAMEALEHEPDETFSRTVAHCVLGLTDYWAAHDDEAQGALEVAVRLARSDGNDLAAAYALGYLALVQIERGNPDGAERVALQATTLSDEPGFAEHFVLMIAHLALGRGYEMRGDLREARAALERSLELARRGAGRIELAAACLALAAVARQAGADVLVREARGLVELCADPGIVAASLGAAGGWRQPAGTAEELTERELEVLRLLPSRLSMREIASALFVTQNTVKTHTKSIYRKLDASNRAEAIARARELRLL
jgi:LuxR family maltose regulon positive regulatory protein